MTKKFTLFALAPALLAVGLSPAESVGDVVEETTASAVHIVLDASAPEEDAKVSPDVKEIRLFFSGEPLVRGASIRLVTSRRSLVRTTPPAIDPEDGTQLFVNIGQTLAPGAYVVQWRCIADDGHVMRGDFRFEVA